MTRRERRILGVILFVAFAVRLAYILELRGDVLFEHPPLDEGDYVMQARSFAHRRPYELRPFWQPPAIFYAIGRVMRVAGDGLLWPRVAQAVVGTLVCALVFAIAKRLFDTRIALATAAIVALHGALIFAGGELLPATWACACNLLALWLLLDAHESVDRAFTAGVALGVSALFTPVILPFAMVAAVMLRPHPRSALALVAGVMLPITPVAIRNYHYSNDWVLISTNGGLNFYIGNNAHYFDTLETRSGLRWEALVDGLPEAAGVTGAVAKSRWFYEQGLHFWTTHPLQALGLYLRKLWLYFHGAEIPRSTDLYDFREGSYVLRALVGPRGFWFPNGLLMPLALVGIATSVRDRVRLAWPLLFVGLQAAVVALFFVSSRYRVPALPMLVMFAVVGAVTIMRARERARVAFIASTVLLMIVLSLPSREVNYRITVELDIFRGLAYRTRGDQPRALEAFRRATVTAPNDARSWIGLGLAYNDAGHAADAADAWERVAKLDPSERRALRDAAAARMRSGDRAAAIRDLRENIANRIKPEDVDDHILLARIYADGNELDAALGELREAVACHPEVGRKGADNFARAYQLKITDPYFWTRFAEIMQ